MRAQAVVAVGPGEVRFQSVHVPEPADEDVAIDVTHSWISPGTEGSFVRGERIDGETPYRTGQPLPFPHVLGYQKVGVVTRVGSAVSDVAPGDIVFATVSHVEGMYFPFGGHVSPAVTHVSQVWKVPPGIDPVALSGLVLAQVGYNCGSRPTLDVGDAAVVLGDGLVGQWAAQTLAQRNVRVLLVGRHDERLAAFGGSGHRLVNAREEDPFAVAAAWAPDGLQAAIDTVGSVADLEWLYPLMRRDGHLVSAGFNGTSGEIDIQRMRSRELTLHTPSGWTRPRMDATLALLVAGKLHTLPLVTHRFPVQQAHEAFDLILQKREPFLGIILNWTEM